MKKKIQLAGAAAYLCLNPSLSEEHPNKLIVNM
jgi:hypothetical protein